LSEKLPEQGMLSQLDVSRRLLGESAMTLEGAAAHVQSGLLTEKKIRDKCIKLTK
jgi:hypothetical protein